MSNSIEKRTTGISTISTTLSIGVLIPASHSGTLNRFLVVQDSGTLSGFAYTLYSSSAACPLGVNPTLASDAALYEVLPSRAVPSTKNRYQGVSGSRVGDGVFELEAGFQAQDGTPMLRQPHLVLLITPTWADSTTKTFSVALTINDPN